MFQQITFALWSCLQLAVLIATAQYAPQSTALFVMILYFYEKYRRRISEQEVEALSLRDIGLRQCLHAQEITQSIHQGLRSMDAKTVNR